MPELNHPFSMSMYELQQDVQPSVGEANDLNAHQVTRMVQIPYHAGTWGDLSAQDNEVGPQSPIPEGSQPQNEIQPQSPVPEQTVSSHI